MIIIVVGKSRRVRRGCSKRVEERGSMLQMWWPVRSWNTPPEWEGKSPHLHPAPPKGGPKFGVFLAPLLRPPAGSLVGLLLLSGDVERNPGPGRRWQCALCSQYIKNKIPNIHTLQPHHNTLGTHNMHKHNTNPIHKPLEMRTTHNTRCTSSTHTPHKHHQPIPNHLHPND